uniref:Chitin-binding type-2 domain-containing protein n=1 Tax=Panagrellus redivivus TaxID=6233 RepID=A0A7E4ZXT4_PANRE
MRCTLRLVVAFGFVAALALANPEKEVTGAEKPTVDEPQYWQAILGDICQLPGFPRATGDPQRYVECVKQNLDTSDRKDLGIWLLRECLPGYEFVASARRCKTTRSIRRQQALCDGPNATNYQFCPSSDNVEFTIQELRQAPRQCSCPNGEANCVCPTPEILEPVTIKRSRRQAQQQNLPNCPCPNQQTNCVCLNAQTATPTVYQDTCCQQQQQPPCQCNSAQSQQYIQSNTPLLSATQAPMSTVPASQQQYPGTLPVAQTTNSPNCQCSPTPLAPSTTPAPASNDCVCPPGQAPIQQQQPQQAQPNNCQTTTTQQQYCPQQNQQTTVVQPQACPLVQGGVANARYQGICSWMVDPLATDPESTTHFLQCQPAPNNLFCGRWQRMPCAPATKFDVSAQVCVWDSTSNQPGNLPTPAPYVSTQPQYDSSCGCTGGVQIGSCNSNYQCPGQSVCQVGQTQQSGQSSPCMVCCYYQKKKML